MIRGTEGDRRRAGYLGAAIGGGLGASVGIPVGAFNPHLGVVVGGALSGAGGALGYNTGYDLLDKATPPQPVSRDILQKQFEHSKGHD